MRDKKMFANVKHIMLSMAAAASTTVGTPDDVPYPRLFSPNIVGIVTAGDVAASVMLKNYIIGIQLNHIYVYSNKSLIFLKNFLAFAPHCCKICLDHRYDK